MTSDEAVKILTSQWGGCSDALGLVVALSSLGILKLEPKSVMARAEEAFAARRKSAPWYAHEVFSILDEAGLQIIEKGQ